MATAVFVRSYISKLPEGQIFATRELLTFGKRSAVDKVLQTLTLKGAILRLARGIFVRADVGLETPSLEEIVRAKARAFSKLAVSLGCVVAKKFGLKKSTKNMSPKQKVQHKKNEEVNESCAGRYAIVGATTSFETVHGRVLFKAVAPRKHILAQNKVGRILVALWHLGKSSSVEFEALQSMARLKRPEKKLIKKLAAWTPSWLNQYFLNGTLRADICAPADLDFLRRGSSENRKRSKKEDRKYKMTALSTTSKKVRESIAYYKVA
ncbi:MAG: hypothetical protein IAF58_19890 [Leptolyngbya sp.]|nr:hypothetical protein [Candidatus Melainabacteria bacterium]